MPPDDTARNFASYNGNNFVPKGRLMIAVESGGWTIQSEPFIFVVDLKANIIGRNFLPKNGIKLIQDKRTQNEVPNIYKKEEASDEDIKTWVKENYVFNSKKKQKPRKASSV